MIIARLKGGLGNQMFIYALGRHLSIKNNTKLWLDATYLKLNNIRHNELKYFNIPTKEIPIPFGLLILPRIFFKVVRILSKKLKRDSLHPVQKDYYFDKSVLEKNVFVLDYYWLGEDYFKDIGNIIRKDFVLKDKPNKKNREMLEKINNSNSVCIHVRRGDLVKKERGKEAGRIYSSKYYRDAIKLIARKVKNPHFFVFSDGLQWAKNNLKTGFPTTYVGINSPREGYKDLNLMKHCKHFILANSTFSWWAAWLSENKDKIITAPKPWFAPLRKGEKPKNTKSKWLYIRDEGDIVPKEWIRIKD